jgi:putative ABC transport system permease protein
MGTVWLDWQVYGRRFHDDAVELFAVRLKPGASRTLARQELLGQFDTRAPVLILDGEEFRGYLDRLVDRWRAISYIQLIAAVLISLVGIGSFLVVSIVERRRELGLIVVLGATPGQLRRFVLVEALGVAAAGLMLGASGGILLQAYLLFALQHSLNGYALPWAVDAPLAAALLVAVPVAALLAAALPLQSLNRMNLAREVAADA